MINVERLDHLVLTVADLERTCAFYEKVLGMRVVTLAQGRTAVTFGAQKINLHVRGREFEPKASRPTPGSGDLCFIVTTPMEAVIGHLANCGVEIEHGPVPRAGATGPILSVYIRDPDGNLIELASLRAAEGAE